jgi:hypothetical protein
MPAPGNLSLDPRSLAEFRCNTASDAMATVKLLPWRCAVCGKRQFSLVGRKRHLSGKGFTCPACVSRRKP